MAATAPEPRHDRSDAPPIAEHALIGERPHYNVTFLFLALGGLALAVSQSLVAPALREIQIDVGVSTTAATWVLTSFLLSASVATPILGRLGDMFGKKRVLVIALTAVAIGTFVSAVAGSLGLLVAGRVIQGLGGGVFPLSMAIIRDEFPRERVAGGIALISAILGVGGGLGIVLAGPIVDHLNYHWLFWFPFVVVTIAAVGVFLVVPESPIRTRGRVDWAGAVLLAGWLVALLLPISEGRSWGWTSGRVLGLFAAAVVLALAWIAVEIRSREPLVDMRMMRLRGVWTTNATAVLLGAGMFGSFILVPQLVELPKSTGYGFGGSVTQAGLYLLPSALMMLVFSVVAGRIISAVGPRLPLILGTSISVLSFLVLALAHSEGYEILLGTTLLGIGIGFAYSAMANQIVDSVPSEQTGVATGMNTIMRTIGGSLGATVSAVIISSFTASDGLPREQGFTIAFAVSAVALAGAVLAALAVPARR
ncbi:MAG TPA: MFS transporter [Gaiellaceae bacterium]|jgi:EmrB/QacA subfamily drug resistance transporter